MTLLADQNLLAAEDDQQRISAVRLAALLRVTTAELAIVAGYPHDALVQKSHEQSAMAQSRLREVSGILASVVPWAGSLPAAYAWYRSQPLPSFGDVTAEVLIREGRGELVKTHLDRIASGSFT